VAQWSYSDLSLSHMIQTLFTTRFEKFCDYIILPHSNITILHDLNEKKSPKNGSSARNWLSFHKVLGEYSEKETKRKSFQYTNFLTFLSTHNLSSLDYILHFKLYSWLGSPSHFIPWASDQINHWSAQVSWPSSSKLHFIQQAYYWIYAQEERFWCGKRDCEWAVA
jgi:hypothetical protein